MCPSMSYVTLMRLKAKGPSPHGLWFSYAIVTERSIEGEGIHDPETLKRSKSVHYLKVTYVFMRSLSFGVVEPCINWSETFWIWILFIRWLTMWQSDRPYPLYVILMMLQWDEGFHMPMSLPIMMNKSDLEWCWWRILPLKGQPGSDPSAL